MIDSHVGSSPSYCSQEVVGREDLIGSRTLDSLSKVSGRDVGLGLPIGPIGAPPPRSPIQGRSKKGVGYCSAFRGRVTTNNDWGVARRSSNRRNPFPRLRAGGVVGGKQR